MRRIALRVAVAAVLAGAGWAVGYAQAQEPDFVLRVVAPGGTTSVECVRGCTFRYTRIGTDGATRTFQTSEFTQGCPKQTCEISASGVLTR